MMKEPLFEAYSGPLTLAELAEGMNAAAENASRLCHDAEILLDAKRFPTAVSVALLAIEEAGKLTILRQMVLASDVGVWKKAWRAYRSHKSKNAAWMFPSMVGEGARKLDEFRALFDGSSNHPLLADQLKQLGLYTDCVGQRRWSVPTALIDEGPARAMVETARVMARKPEHPVTVRELELWREHLGAVQGAGFETQKRALACWVRALVAEGLHDQQSLDGFMRFLGLADDTGHT
ncbi:AbiV family abortive infection protein [Anaeromyxobacter oryzisoli]|uniref:AbiV family abortive infection protein n=1 Tax=Anaeromyxobacter oryzisoli TaxID=2925408 RepID=UPI001F5A3909|nr:AbiV family abortive infection protein [Anaeromyxobacter sp. SG63]